MSNVFYTGNTGRSTGPHLDFQVYNPSTGDYEDPGAYTRFLTVNGQPFNYPVTSPRGYRTHPVTGQQNSFHRGVDYGTPSGTAVTVDGRHLATWDDPSGGRMSQYLVQTENGPRELLLLHGSYDNATTGSGANTTYQRTGDTVLTASGGGDQASDPKSGSNDGGSGGASDNSNSPGTFFERQSAKERIQTFQKMSKPEMNSAYDKMRSEDPVKAADTGLEMHRAKFIR